MEQEIQTIRKALVKAGGILARAGVESPRLDAEVLLAEVLGGRREDLLADAARELTRDEIQTFRNLLERRMNREPLAYILGHKEFWSLAFKVNPSVLIPRPETEGVVRRLLELVSGGAFPETLRILDVGTGSGILAVVAALHYPRARVTAWDVSREALDVARENAWTHGVVDRIEFIHRDMANGFADADEKFHFILSNPPYIDTETLRQLMPEVKDREPHLALDGGPQGMDGFQPLIALAEAGLWPGGYLVMEIGDRQGALVCERIDSCEVLEPAELIVDYSGHDRVVSTRRAAHG